MEEEEFETKRKRRYHLILFKMENDEAIRSYRFFKLRWTPSEVANTFVFETLLVRSARSHGPDPTDSSDEASSSTTDHGFYEFEDGNSSVSARSEQTRVRGEVFRYGYLNDSKKDVSMLQEFPAMKAVFIRFNTNLCSSAAVERLFSFASLVLKPNRRCLEDELFEKLLPLKCH